MCRELMGWLQCGELIYLRRCGRFSRWASLVRSKWRSRAIIFTGWESLCGRGKELNSILMSGRRKQISPLRLLALRSGREDRAACGISDESADDQHFPHVVAGEKEFDRRKIAEQSFDVPVIEHPLQLEPLGDRGMDRTGGTASGFAPQHNPLHLKRVLTDNVEAAAPRIRSRIFGV